MSVLQAMQQPVAPRRRWLPSGTGQRSGQPPGLGLRFSKTRRAQSPRIPAMPACMTITWPPCCWVSTTWSQQKLLMWQHQSLACMGLCTPLSAPPLHLASLQALLPSHGPHLRKAHHHPSVLPCRQQPAVRPGLPPEGAVQLSGCQGV